MNLILLLKQFLRTVRQYGVLFLVITLAGAGCGYAFYRIQKPVYKSRMLANSQLLQNAEVVGIVESWGELLNTGERSLLAERLGVSPQTISKLYGIEAKDNKGAGTTDGFSIEVLVGDNAILNNLQKAIVSSLEQNPFVRKRVSLKKRTLELIKEETAKEIAALERSRQAVQTLIESGGRSSGAFLVDPGNINLQIIQLREKLFNTDEAIALIDDFQVIEGFTVSNAPESPKLARSLLIGTLLGAIIAILIISTSILRAKMRELPA